MSRPDESHEERQSHFPPETHNDEQEEHLQQAQQVAKEARQLTPATEMPTASEKGRGKSGLMNDSTQDTVDHMRDMEESGRIDMDSYRGEPNYDDDGEKYGHKNRIDESGDPVPNDGREGR